MQTIAGGKVTLGHTRRHRSMEASPHPIPSRPHNTAVSELRLMSLNVSPWIGQEELVV